MKLWIAGLLLVYSCAGQNTLPSKENHVTQHATGTFEVKVAPVEASPIAAAASVGRMTLDKIFSGELEGTSKGEMLTGMTEATGAMAYVAMERVTGKLHGRAGTFLLMHNGTMLKSNPAAGELSVVVVPASGTGDLAGLSGKLAIVIDKTGKHSYDLEYTLP